MTLSEKDIAHLGNEEPNMGSPDLLIHQQVQRKGLDEIYLDLWPTGCERPTQTPDWNLFQRKLDRLLKNNDKGRKLWFGSPTHEYKTTAKNKKHPGKLVFRSEQPEQEPSKSVSEVEIAWDASEEESLLAFKVALPPLANDFDMNRPNYHASAHHEGPLLDIPPTDPTCDKSWAFVADELHTARTELCLEMDLVKDEGYDADQDEGKSDDGSQLETHTLRIRELVPRRDGGRAVGGSNEDTIPETQAKILLISNCALLIDLLQNNIAPSEELRKSIGRLCAREWCSDSSSREGSLCHSLMTNNNTNDSISEAHELKNHGLLHLELRDQKRPETYHSRLKFEDCGSDYFSNEDRFHESEIAPSRPQSILKKQVHFDSEAMKAPEDGPEDSLRSREMRAYQDEDNAEVDIWRQRCLHFNKAGQHLQTQPADRGDLVRVGGSAKRKDAENEAEKECEEDAEEDSEEEPGKNPEIGAASRRVWGSTLLRRLSLRSRTG